MFRLRKNTVLCNMAYDMVNVVEAADPKSYEFDGPAYQALDCGANSWNCKRRGLLIATPKPTIHRYH